MHDNLWAPWRMEFIKDARQGLKESPFIEILADSDDRKNLLLYRGELAFVVLNKYPYTNGHLLIMPNAKKAELHDLDSAEHAEMLQLTAAAVQILRKVFNADGVNCGINLGKAAGAGILDHIHMHVVPRWVGDTNFLPVLSNTRCLPEYLDETYQRLHAEFAALK